MTPIPTKSSPNMAFRPSCCASTPHQPVKSSWSKADSSGGPKRLLDSGSSEDSGFSAQLGTATGASSSLLPSYRLFLFPVHGCTCKS